METVVYGGSTKNHIISQEIIEPIADYVAKLILQKLETNEESAKKLIHRFGKINTPQ